MDPTKTDGVRKVNTNKKFTDPNFIHVPGLAERYS